jgi:serine protease Do
LEIGDTVLTLNGETVADPRDLAVKVAGIQPGENVALIVLRDGKRTTQTVRIGTLPDTEKVASVKPAPKAENTSLKTLGLSLAPAGQGDDGVVVAEVDPEGPAGVKGIQPGDHILEVAGKSVASVSDVQDRIKEAEDKGRKSVLVLVQSSGGQRFVALQLGNA